MSFPASLTTRTVKGRFVTYPAGASAQGKVRIVLNDFMQGPTDDAFVAPFDQTFKLDHNGEFSAILPATNDPQWTHSYYKVTITLGEKVARSSFILPYDDPDDFNLADNLNLPASTPGEQYVLLAAKGVPGGVASLGTDGKIIPSQIPLTIAATVDWNDVNNKPTAFPHDEVTYGQVTNKPDTFPPSAHGHSYSEITDKPTTFPPSTHEHPMAEVTGLGSALAAKADGSALASGLATKANTVHTHTTAQVTGLDTALTGKANAAHAHIQSDISGLTTALASKADATSTTAAINTKADVTTVNTALAGKADLVGGLVPTSQLPAITVVDFLGSISTQAAMLALTGQKGDWVIRTDLGQTWVITGNNPAQLASWTAMPLANVPVQTVNGQTGAVVLGRADIGLGNVDNTSDTNKPVSTAQQTALNNKADLVSGKVATAQIPDFANAWALFPNIKDTQYAGGAKGDNATDDSAAIQAAWNAAKAAKIGMVLAPSGVYIAKDLVLPTGVHVWGAGASGDIYSNVDSNMPFRGTVFKLKNGANTDLIKTENFATLTGLANPSSYLTPARFGLHHLVLDGNRANNTTGLPLRIFGRTYTIDNVIVQNGASGGVYSEWGAGGYEMEAKWSNFTITDNSGIGLDWHGPHDSQFVNGLVARNDGYVGIKVGGGQVGGEMFANVHVWGNHTYQWVIDSYTCMFSNCVADGTNGVQVLSSGHQWIGGCIYGSNTVGEVGITIGDGTVRTITSNRFVTRMFNYKKGSIPVRFWPDQAGQRLNTFHINGSFGGNTRYAAGGGKGFLTGTVTFPVTTLDLDSASTFPATSVGSVYISDGTNITTVNYTGVTGNTLTGVSGGTGTFGPGTVAFSASSSLAQNDWELLDTDNFRGGFITSAQSGVTRQFLQPVTFNTSDFTVRPNTSSTAMQLFRNETSRRDFRWANDSTFGQFFFENGSTIEGWSGSTSGTRTWKLDGATGAIQGSSVSVTVAAKTAAYTLTATDSVVTADAAISPFAVTLPTAVGVSGRSYTIKRINTGSNAVTVATTSSQTIDGSTAYILSMPNASVQVISDGSNWRVVNKSAQTIVNVKDFGVKGDATGGNSCQMTAGSPTLTSSGAGFTTADVGKVIGVAGAGTGGAALISTIASFVNGNSVTLAANAVTTVTASNFIYGTDDTVAATDAANSLSGTGGQLFWPRGGYFVHGIPIHTGVHFVGEGTGHDLFSTTAKNAFRGTWLLATPGSNDDVVRTWNFATKTGSGTVTGSPQRLGLHNMVIDQLNLNGYNTSGWCAKLYAAPYSITDVVFQYGSSGGVWSEHYGGGYDMECMWDRWYIKNCKGTSLYFDGPHDPILSDGIVSAGTVAGTIGIDIAGGASAGYNISNVHVWGGFDWCWVVRCGGELVNCKGEGGTQGQLKILASQTNVTAGSWFNGTVAGSVGIQLGDTNIYPSRCKIDTTIFDVKVPIKVVIDSGYNVIKANIFTSGVDVPPITGVENLQDSTYVEIVSNTGTAGVHDQAGRFSFPGTLAISNQSASGFDVRAHGEANPRVRVDTTPEASAQGVLVVRSSTLATGTPDIARFYDKFGVLKFTVTQGGPMWGDGNGFGVIRNGGGRTSLRMQDVLNAVNYPQIGNNVTGSAPYFGVEGTDTNVDLVLKPKGAGSVVSSSVVKAAGISLNLVTKTAAYTLTATDSHVLADATTGAMTITLPTAVGAAGRSYTIKRINGGSNTVTVGTTSSQTVDGLSSYVLTLPNAFVEVISDGSNWRVVAKTDQTITNVRDHGAKGDDVTNDDAAFAAAYAAVGQYGTVLVPKGNYVLTNLDPPNQATTIGIGESSRIIYRAAGTLCTLTNKQRVKFRNLLFWMPAAATVDSTLFKLSNSFRCSWHNVIFQGNHTTAGDVYGITTGHIGVNITDNAGDNMFYDCDFNNLGVGIRTDSIQNAVVGGKFGTCYVGIHGARSGGTYPSGRANGGMSISGYVDFVSPVGTGIVAYNIWIEDSNGQWWIDHVWMEGADTCIKVGTPGLLGAVSFGLSNSKLAANVLNLDIQNVRQPQLFNVQFGYNPGYTPRSLQINPAVTDGNAVGLISTTTGDPAISGTDYADGTFPEGWSYVGRSYMKVPTRMGGHAQWTSDADNKTALQVYGRNGQTVDIMSVYSNIGGTIAKRMWFDQFGLVHFGGGGGNGGTAAQAVFASSGQLGIYPAGTAAPNPDPAGAIDACLSVTARAPGSRPVVITGYTAQTANLVDYRTTTGTGGSYTSTVRTAINAGGTYVASDPAAGVVLMSPNGHYWRVTVSDAGALTTTDLGTTAPTT